MIQLPLHVQSIGSAFNISRFPIYLARLASHLLANQYFTALFILQTPFPYKHSPLKTFLKNNSDWPPTMSSNSLQTQTPIPIQSQILAGCNPRHSTNPISSQIHARQVPPLRCSQASPHTARNLAHNSEAEDTTIHRLCRSGFRRR